MRATALGVMLFAKERSRIEREKEGNMKLFHRILVATDFSAASTPAFKEAILMAKENGAELMIANAYQPPNIIEADSARRLGRTAAKACRGFSSAASHRA